MSPNSRFISGSPIKPYWHEQLSETPLDVELPSDSPLGSQLPSASPLGSQLLSDSPPGSQLPLDSPPGSQLPSDSPPGSQFPSDSLLASQFPSDSLPGSQLPSDSPAASQLPSDSPPGSQDLFESPPGSQYPFNSQPIPSNTQPSSQCPSDSQQTPQCLSDSPPPILSDPETKYSLPSITSKWKAEEPTSVMWPYSWESGPCTGLGSNASALDYFSLFFTDAVWDLILEETNRYATQVQSSSTSPNARPWHDVTKEELCAFFGILIVMGIVHLPRQEMYWQQSHPLLQGTQIPEIMTLVRFEQIWRFLHLADSEKQIPQGQPGHDKLYKVRAFLDLLSERMQSVYRPNREVSIDEAMIPFKGRLSFLQYMKAKPTKWGIKLFVLADAHNGYVYRYQVYAGRNIDNLDNSVGLTSRVVLDLLHGLESHGFEVYTDNYYTSPQLFLYLYNQGTNAVGTCRVNRRSFPKELALPNHCTRGTYKYRSNGPLLACAWFDKRPVYFLSTSHVAVPPGGLSTVKRREGSEKVDVPCPPLLEDYVKFMRGVDRGDQLISLYNAGRRSKKWWRRILFHMVEVCLLNGYALEGCVKPRSRGHKKRDLLSFRIEVAESLIGSYRGRK